MVSVFGVVSVGTSNKRKRTEQRVREQEQEDRKKEIEGKKKTTTKEEKNLLYLYHSSHLSFLVLFPVFTLRLPRANEMPMRRCPKSAQSVPIPFSRPHQVRKKRKKHLLRVHSLMSCSARETRSVELEREGYSACSICMSYHLSSPVVTPCNHAFCYVVRRENEKDLDKKERE